MKNIKISVIGGGNIGMQFSCICASKGFDTTLYASKPDKFNKAISIVDGNGNETVKAELTSITDDIKSAMESDLIFVTYPSFMFSDLAKKMETYVKKGQLICVLPGTGGAEFAFRKCMDNGAVLFGLQRVPCVARIAEYGKTVCVQGKRHCIYLASIPSCYSAELSEFMSDLLDMPCKPLNNYLSVTMTPSNPLLHSSRLSTMFSDYTKGKVYERNPYFYGEWTDEASKRLLDCDKEHQNMLKMLDKMDLTDVKSLVVHYDDSDTPSKMTEKLKSIKSLNGLSSPMKQANGGWIPDFDSRYFTADFPYGLAIIEEFGRVIGADIPKIKKTMQWYQNTTGNYNSFKIGDFGINSVKDIYNLYL